ncbi:MAG: SMC-Scp complex subunit ScpB [Patescibacteria group bacterium]|jgi:segregation and condensation protein B
MLNLHSALESLIFASGKPIEIKKLGKICNVEEKKVQETLKILNREYEKNDRGLRLILQSDVVQMVTNPKNSEIVKSLSSSELAEDLSAVSLESLTIIAYKGPITRAELEAIRGVNCLYVLRNLLIRGLIEKKQHPKDSRLGIYAVTTKFLRHLGLNKISDLPNYEEMKAKIIQPVNEKKDEPVVLAK